MLRSELGAMNCKVASDGIRCLFRYALAARSTLARRSLDAPITTSVATLTEPADILSSSSTSATRAAVNRAELRDRLRFHDRRHTRAALLIANGRTWKR